MSDQAYVVESPALENGVKVGVFRVYVATEARAKEIAEAAEGRTYRCLPISELPVAARDNLLNSTK